ERTGLSSGAIAARPSHRAARPHHGDSLGRARDTPWRFQRRHLHMRRLHSLAALLLIGGTTAMAAPLSTGPGDQAEAYPLAGMPLDMAGDAPPALWPGEGAVLFARGLGAGRGVLISRRDGDGWTTPQPAPFSSGTWVDMEPAMAPDGSALVFASNRPAQA